MGQVKGTPSYTTQQQAYINKYGASNPSGRDAGSKPAMIAGNTTLNSVVDTTFATDANITTTTATLTSLSASLAARLTAIE
jgi:hypothetical protein